MSRRIKWIISIAGGLMAASAWWGQPLPALLICFVPLLLTDDELAKEGEPVLSVLPFAWVFFFVWNAAATWWLARIHLLGGLTVILLNASLMCLAFLFYSVSRRRTGAGLFAFIVIWAGFEFMHYYSDLSWPWLSLGNGLAGNVMLIQWYEYTGATGGSVWVLSVNLLIYSTFSSFRRQSTDRSTKKLASLLAVTILVPVIISLHLFNVRENDGDRVGFLILQPGLDPYEDKFDGSGSYERMEGLLKLAAENMEENTRYIVGPETAVDSIRINDPEDPLLMMASGFLEQYPGVGMFLGATTIGYITEDEKSYTTRTDDAGNLFDIYNSLLFIVPGTDIGIYHKHYLANGVEQVPFQSVFRFAGSLSVDLGGVAGSLGKGTGRQVFSSPLADSTVIGPLICFESAYGEYAGGLAAMGAEILLVVSNDGWFKNTGAYRQHLRLSQIRAVESRRSLVRAANTGISCHISHLGVIIDKTEWWEKEALAVNVTANDDITIFSVYGDYPGRISFFFLILILLNLLSGMFYSPLKLDRPASRNST
jgi:apolipoprotein N-acyltransferase